MLLRNPVPKTPVSTVLFDFDGTLSTLRWGWEKVMEPMMAEFLGEGSEDIVRAYIDESTGVQTIHQMKWLAEQIRLRGGIPKSPWEYKDEYNRRLMETVSGRRRALLEGEARPEDFLIAGSQTLLKALREEGAALYVASGTDDSDVKAEASALGLTGYFAEIAGAPERSESCSKEAVILKLLASGIPGEYLAVVGDGKVEIAVGKENGARTLGVASDEAALSGINETKLHRLEKAGADAITGDFLALGEIMNFFMGR
jgi:phosphoglycolate phosphatase-like HAD superfamily hydrolase